MPTLAQQVPNGADHLARRVANLERQLRELRAATPLANASIGTIGLSVTPYGLQIGGNVEVTGDLTVDGQAGDSTVTGVINVMAHPYNATGDGQTDDTGAIQQALNDAASAGWGFPARTVQLPARFFAIRPLTIPHGVTLRGAGMRATTLIALGGQTDGSYLVSNAAGARMTTVRDLRIIGMTGLQGTAKVHGILLDGSGTGNEYSDMRGQIHCVDVEDCTGDAFTLADAGVCQVANCQAWDNGGNGFVIGIDNEVVNCDAGNCKNGFVVNGNSLVANCKAWFSGYYNGAVPSGLVSGGDGHGFKISGASDGNLFTGIYAQDNAACGILILNSSRITIAGWVSDSNNNYASGTASNVQIDNSYGVAMLGGFNLDRLPGNAARPVAGLDITNGSDTCQVQCNTSGLQAYLASSPTTWGNLLQFDAHSGASASQGYASSFTPDNSQGSFLDVGTLTGNMTVNAPSLSVNGGHELTLSFTQDATGKRTLTWDPIYRTTWQPNPTANSASRVTFEWNSNNGTWDETSSTEGATRTVWGNTAKAFSLGTAGGGVAVKEGSNARMGVATLSGGSAVVSNTSVTSSTRIFLTCQTPGGTPGFLRVGGRSAGTSFTITSSSSTDTSSVGWLLVEPA